MRKILSKSLIVLLVLLILLNMYANVVFAAVEINIDRALIKTIGYAEDHLKYYREKTGEYTYHKTILTGYEGKDGKIYPVYCLNIKLPGADEEPYYVTTKNIISNDKIWRIIKNGYSFKKAKDWGLEDEKDLYAITRFAIYCVLGQEKLSFFKAEENDKEAVAMLSALKKLVNIGENGIEKQTDNPLKYEKIGELNQLGDFYVQEYKIKSEFDFNKYKVEKVLGLPEGGYIANKEGLEKSEFLSSENLFVMIPKDKMKDNLDINIKINAECKAYLVLEGKSTISGKQDYAVTVGENSIFNSDISLKEKVNKSGLVIYKTDNDSKEAIKDVEFSLFNENGDFIEKKTTNENGKVEFSNLIQGKYIVKETKENEKYIKLDTDIEVELEYNKIKTIGITNEHKKRKFENI